MKSLKSWLNKVFCQNVTPDSTEASLNASVEVINTSDTNGIGEPILSFIETFRSNPERFTRVGADTCHGMLIDTFTNIGFELSKYPCRGIRLHSWKCEPNPKLKLITCFSEKELEYLWDSLVYNRDAMSRLKRLNKYKDLLSQRKELMEVYYNEIR